MQNKTLGWIAGSVAAFTGWVTLSVKVKSLAARLLDDNGALDSLRTERIQSLEKIYGKDALKNVDVLTEYPVAVTDPLTKGAVDEVNKRWWTEKDKVMAPAERFSSAWKILPSNKRTMALAFASGVAVFFGGVTYGLGRLIQKPGGSSSSESGCYTGYYGGGDGGSHGGGHSHSGDCGGGFFGGGFGGHCGVGF